MARFQAQDRIETSASAAGPCVQLPPSSAGSKEEKTSKDN